MSRHHKSAPETVRETVVKPQDERVGGFGMADPTDRPAARETAKGATPAPAHHFNDDHERRAGKRRHGGSQPGMKGADIDDSHPERTGYEQPESQQDVSGDGHDERGDYGRGPAPGAQRGANTQKK